MLVTKEIESYPYRGYRIKPIPYQERGSREWGLGLVFTCRGERGIWEIPIAGEESFDNFEEAVQQSLLFGKKMIDRQFDAQSRQSG